MRRFVRQWQTSTGIWSRDADDDEPMTKIGCWQVVVSLSVFIYIVFLAFLSCEVSKHKWPNSHSLQVDIHNFIMLKFTNPNSYSVPLLCCL